MILKKQQDQNKLIIILLVIVVVMFSILSPQQVFAATEKAAEPSLAVKTTSLELLFG